jgi:RsbRD-like negative regulator of sigma factor
MLTSTKLVKLIEDHADELTKKWQDRVRNHPATPTYHTYDEKKLYDRAFGVYSNLHKWISQETSKEDVKKIYKDLGAQRCHEGFALSELIQALIITRRVLWYKVQTDGLLDSAMDHRIALELNNMAIVFFDHAILFASQGYESAK